jgi:hypothetical protein
MRRMTAMRSGAIRGVWAGIVLAALSANLGCDFDVAPNLGKDNCDGHGGSETWCEGDQLMTCQQGDWSNQKQVVKSCRPGNCYGNPRTGTSGCSVPGYTCPAGTTGYQCHGDRRIDCLSGGVAWDLGVCNWSAGPGAPSMTCVPNPGGEVLPCGYAAEKCTTPGEVRCLGNGAVVCRESVWQAYVPNTTTGQSVCDASTIRYGRCTAGSEPRYDSWCEGEQVLHCDRCVQYSDEWTYQHLCVAFSVVATCQVLSLPNHSQVE